MERAREQAPVPLGRADLAGESARHGAVVIGLDGSDSSWDAFWWGLGEAQRMQHRIVVVYVSSPATLAAAISAAAGATVCDFATLERAARDDAERIRSELKRHAGEQGIEMLFVHARGDAAQEILRVAKQAQADVVVVGRSAKAAHRLAGSIGRRLIRCKDAPIVVVVP